MDWRDRIVVSPDVLHGAPRIRGTRVPVSVVLDNVAAGLGPEEIQGSYPAITRDDIRAALEYAAELTREHTLALPLEATA